MRLSDQCNTLKVCLCAVLFLSGCKGTEKPTDGNSQINPAPESSHQHNHPNTAQGTKDAVNESLLIETKALALLPPLQPGPAACETELKNVESTQASSPGSDAAAAANLAYLSCTAKASNTARCKGKAQPCGVVYYNPPVAEGQPAADPVAVDISVPAQITSACSAIGAAAGSATVGDPTVGVILGSAIGNYTCGAWFKAAANNDPTLLVAPQLVPTIQLLRDLREFTGGNVDLTPEAAAKTIQAAVARAPVTVQVAGQPVPVAILPIIPVGGTPGQVLDHAQGEIQKQVNHITRDAENACKKIRACH